MIAAVQHVVIPGTATGPLLVSPAPLSFWGGVDAETGEIIDRRHPLSGQCITGVVLALPWTRGSSTTTAILLEAIRRRTAPAAILLPKSDMFLALASVVALELYERAVPTFVVDVTSLAEATGLTVTVSQAGVHRGTMQI
jgi:predicted aconitase with swiveling domain